MLTPRPAPNDKYLHEAKSKVDDYQAWKLVDDEDGHSPDVHEWKKVDKGTDEGRQSLKLKHDFEVEEDEYEME